MPHVDGYFFPQPPAQIYAAGEQSHVPLLAGTNSEESGYSGTLGQDNPTVENYKNALRVRFHEQADQAFRFYPASADGKPVQDAAQTLPSDLFIGFSTWKWLSLHENWRTTYLLLLLYASASCGAPRGCGQV